jgi:hypothetical protein
MPLEANKKSELVAGAGLAIDLMPLEANERSELVAAAGLAIDLDEPESFIEALRRVASRKGDNERLSDQERARWRLVARSLADALKVIEGEPKAPQAAQAAPQATVDDKIASHRP